MASYLDFLRVNGGGPSLYDLGAVRPPQERTLAVLAPMDGLLLVAALALCVAVLFAALDIAERHYR